MEYNIRIAQVLGMLLIVEVHNLKELEFALSFPEIEAILVSQRDLQTMQGTASGLDALLAPFQQQINSRDVVVIAEGSRDELVNVPDLVDAAFIIQV